MPLNRQFFCPLPNGIHARPASSLEEISRNFLSEIFLVNERNGHTANLKSVLSIVGADMRHNDHCTLKISGPDERDAFTQLSKFLDTALPHCDDIPTDILSHDGKAQLPNALRRANVTAYRGAAAVAGMASGKIVQTGKFKIPANISLDGVDNIEAECQLLGGALKNLAQLYDKRVSTAKKNIEIELFKAHRAIARDTEFQKQLRDAISGRKRTIAGAIADAEAHFSKMLADSGSELLRERALDIQDVCFELLQQIYRAEINPKKIQLSGDCILVAESLTPGQFLALDRNFLRGLVLPHAGMTSHTVILARSFGIPTLICVHEIANANLENQEAILDADAGALLVNLTDAARRYYTMEGRRLKERQNQIARFAKAPAVTHDGHRIEIGANVVSADEVAAAFKAGAENIGLFRTEMIFIEREAAPDEEEQFEIYRRALVAAKNRPVTIRTLDIGGDKPLDYLNLPAEENPFLGRRAVRLYPRFESLFRTQVRVLVRASAHGKLKLLLPMISTSEEARWVRKIIFDEQQKCAAQKIPFDKAMPVGAMIEVPTAAFAMDALCQELDFFSIGSNDLFQYFMAVDRANADVATLYNPLQPSFLRLLKQIVDAAHMHEKQIGLCGEMGADKKFLPLLVGLRLNQISVAAPVIMELKAGLSKLNFQNCSDLLASALKSKASSEVETLLEQFVGRSDAPLFEPSLVILNADAQTKDEAIKLAVDQLYVLGRTDDSRAVEEAIWQREQSFSTGFGNGFAVPHCKSNAVKSNSLVILKPAEPIVWNSLDGLPVRAVILIATRDGSGAHDHLKIFAKLSRHLMDEYFRAHVENENNPEALCDFICKTLQPKIA